MFNWKRTFSILQFLMTIVICLQFSVITLKLEMANEAFNDLQTVILQHDKWLQGLYGRLNRLEEIKRIDYK